MLDHASLSSVSSVRARTHTHAQLAWQAWWWWWESGLGMKCRNPIRISLNTSSLSRAMSSSSSLALFGGRKRRRDDAPPGGAGSAAPAPSARASRAEGSDPRSSSSSSSSSSSTAAASSFSRLALAPWLLRAVSAMGLRVPTPVQSGTIPLALAGQDLVACAQTGTGKTAAFALPILHRLSEDPYGVFAVVLTPSRELAFQISDQFKAFGAPLGVRVATVTGGTDLVASAAALAGQPHIVVATPGRLAFHVSQGTVRPDISRVGFLVLDEVDRLLEESFRPDVDAILAALGSGNGHGAAAAAPRQTLLYSATITPDIFQDATVARLGLRKDNLQVFDASRGGLLPWPTEGRRGGASGAGDDGDDDGGDEEGSSSSSAPHPFLAPLVTAPNLLQQYLFVPAAVKNAYLWQLLLALGPADLAVGGSGSHGAGAGAGAGAGGKKAKRQTSVVSGTEALSAGDPDGSSSSRARSIIIFTASCRAAQLVSEMCVELGIPCTPLHSAMPQQRRLASLAKFKGGVVRLLVATDVASRGLDIPQVDLVVNYDVPRVPSDYVHRVGRTARAGRGGRAVTVVTQYDVALLQTIEARVLLGKKVDPVPESVCPEAEVLPRLTKVAAALHLAKTRLAESGFEELLEVRAERKAEARRERGEEGGAGGKGKK
jgi:ATP-dependent RNA helicase DDX49/DBP8